MTDEPKGVLTKLWHASLTILGVTIALWLSVKLLLEIWWLLVIVGIIALVAFLLYSWRVRRW